MIVVDSSVWIDNLRGIDNAAVRKLRALDDDEEVLIGDLILLEVLQGARDEPHAARIERNLRRFPIAPMLDADLAQLYGVETRVLVQAVKRNLARFRRISCFSSMLRSSPT